MLKTSPFDAVHRQLDANFADYAGWSLPADFGDIDAEGRAMAEHCAVVDLCSFARLMIKGNAAKDTLTAVFTEKSGSFAPDTWVWARARLDAQDVLCRVLRVNGDFLVLTRPDQRETVKNGLESAANAGLSVADMTEKTAMLGLYGPSAFDSMRKVLPFEIDHLDIGEAGKFSLFMISFTLLRGSWLGSDGLELICPAQAGPIAAGAVAKYRHKYDITPAGMEALLAAMTKAERPL